jgi:cytidylate kinase
MQKTSIITIAGKPGSGKSTTSKGVAAKLQYRHFSSGDLFRSIAADRGLDVKSANQQAEKESSIDDLVDQRLQDMGRTESDIVIDSRTAWHWMPNSFKVYLDLDLHVAAKRIILASDERQSANEYIPEDHEEYVKELQERLDSEARRYESLYGINPYDTQNYDLVVDTSQYSIDEVVDQIVAAYNGWHTQTS